MPNWIELPIMLSGKTKNDRWAPEAVEWWSETGDNERKIPGAQDTVAALPVFLRGVVCG